ncbi:putative major facilitator superfamily transporter [Colletotrichum sublineola]|uniref:Putative major facilitator superfamily transporter n=1 Tax=Colletotrichum sublineola TaxID=1173701 RepID=A0A066X4P6_COLSU|nr:putative major facilitator superfamily transporter [Colletotrichum sublineola]
MSSLPTAKDDGPSADTIEITDAQVCSDGHKAYGTVQLLQDGSVVLIPTPSPDPKAWHKYLFIFIVGAYSAIAVLVTSGLGAVFPSVLKEYPPEDATRATDLLTYPTLFMGIGNLLALDAALRHPGEAHIAGRNIYSLAAGQSEALAPFIIEEIHFLHERSAKLSWFIGVQSVGTAAMFIATAYIVPAWGTKWWYLIATFINAAVLILAFCFAVETKYDRPSDADNGKVDVDGDTEMVVRVLTRENHVLQPKVFGPRTRSHNFRIFHFKPDWSQTVTFYKEAAQSLCLPNILWMLLLNGAFLGIYVYQASTFATILMSPPYHFKYDWLGYVQLVQVLDCVILVPLLGYGSDMLVQALSTWRNGVFQAGAYPDRWHWMTVVAPYNLGYFAFLGANLTGITYAIDSFPSKAGPLLLVICAGRGFISFGLSYSTVPLINLIGYNGAMNIFAIISGALGAMAFPVYYFGARIRIWATKKVWPEIAQ